MKYISYLFGILSLSCLLFCLSFYVGDFYQNPHTSESSYAVFQEQVKQANETAGLEDKGISSSVTIENFQNQTAAEEVKEHILQGVQNSLHNNLKFKLDEQQVDELTNFYVSLYEEQLSLMKEQDLNIYPAVSGAGAVCFACLGALFIVLDQKMKNRMLRKNK